MSPLRLALLILETCLALAAGLALGPRVGPGRALGYVIVSLTWAASILLPAYALAMLHRLTFGALAASSIVLSAVVLAILRPRRDDLASYARSLALAPFDVLRMAWRRKSLVLVGLLFGIGVYLWMLLSAWIAPQRPDVWDPFWYHEPMTAFAIQNQSFEPVHLEFFFQRINAFPREAETLTMWIVMVFGRRLNDVTNLLFVPGFVAAVYLLVRRVSRDVVTNVGWGVLMFIMPCTLSLAQTAHFDTTAMFFLVSGIGFATMRPLTAPVLLAAGVSLGFAVASKTTCLFSVAVMSLVVLVRFIALRKAITRRLAVAMGIGSLVLLSMGSATYLRNYIHFHNPLWPELKVDIDALGIHWPGRVSYGKTGPRTAQRDAQSDENIPFWELMEYVYAAPGVVQDYQYKDTVNYGTGIVWILFPLAAVGIVVLSATYAMALLRRRASEEPNRQIAYALGLALLAFGIYYFSPIRWCAKYHVAAFAILPVIVATLSARPGWRKVAEGACGAALVCSIINFWWAAPRYWVTWTEMKELAALSPLDREIASTRTAYITPAFGRMREELVDGALLVTRKYGLPGLMWNNEYSNRVEYLVGPGDLYDFAIERKAAAAVVKTDEPELAKFRGHPEQWREVTAVDRYGDTFAFRRVN